MIPEVKEERKLIINDLEKYEEEIKAYLNDYMSEFYCPGWRLKSSLEKSCKMILSYKTLIEDSFSKPK